MNYEATLDALEKYHSEALFHVRGLKELHRNSSLASKPAAREESAPVEDWSGITQIEAAKRLLKANGGPMSALDLFTGMKARKHPVANEKSLYNSLSVHADFERPERGKFGLKPIPAVLERPLSGDRP